MNIYDILLIVILAAIIISALVFTIRRKKQGGCSCGCAGCDGQNCPSAQNMQRDR
ncbi:MAG: FeoB-associated Cys-rich membrane protein [Eubacterium sp.]|nr:FeoB-associated Cys-rich membrane protein [Eubacterium sp.]